MKNYRIFKTLLLAVILSIVSEVLCFAFALAHQKGDSRIMTGIYAFNAPGIYASYRLFPIQADMDDHVTGKEGGIEDTLGTAVIFVVPLLQWFVIWLGGIWIFRKTKHFGMRPISSGASH